MHVINMINFSFQSRAETKTKTVKTIGNLVETELRFEHKNSGTVTELSN